MKQFILSLMKNSLRPVVKLESWNNFRALLDTGAFFLDWTVKEKILNDLGGRMLRKDVSFSGVGGSTKGNLYEVEKIVIGDLIYEIDDKNHKLNVTIPDDESNVRNLRIENSNGRLHVLCHSAGL